MREAFLVAAAQGYLKPISGQSHVEQVEPILRELLEKSGAPGRWIEEIHWHGGDQEFWLSALGPSQGASLGFVPEIARFQWPAVALLAHASLHSLARAIEAGDANLVLLAQEAGDQVAALLLASPAAVGNHHLAPRARLDRKMAISSLPDGLLNAARAGLGREEPGQDREKPAENSPPQSDIQWLAMAGRNDLPAFQPQALREVFPAALRLDLPAGTPSADLFLLKALVERLEDRQAQHGLLVSQGPQRSGLATFVERI
jgi:hypothetical protein